VVYGQGAAATSVSVDARELRLALTGEAGTNQLLDLRVGSERHLTLARVIQRHPVRNTVIHVDFQVVSRDEVISVEVPVVTVGDARAVELAQGMMEQPLTSLLVQARPGNIPNEITVDISRLAIGDTVRVGQLVLPAGATTEVDPDEAVIVASASSVAAEVEEIEEEAAEAAAAEAAAEAGEERTEGGGEAESAGEAGAERAGDGPTEG